MSTKQRRVFGLFGAPATTQPMAAGRLGVWLDLLKAYGLPVHPAFWRRAAFVTATSAATAPLRSWARSRSKRSEPEAGPPPLFLIGHYRSGTTYLQNLLALDPQWAILPTARALAPEIAPLPGPWQTILGALLPETRSMDDMAMSVDLPEEPEHAMGALSLFCFYHGFAFPDRLREHYDRYVTLDPLSEAERRNWTDMYTRLARDVSAAGGGRRPFFKNPADTARIPHVLDAFPDAQFIHIVRHPETVFYSSRNFYEQSLRDFALAGWSEEDRDRSIEYVYEDMMTRYLTTRCQIPDGQLVEVRFEDLESAPIETLEGIYDRLGLDGFEVAQPNFRIHVEEQRTYRKNAYPRDTAEVERLREKWRVVYDAFGYTP